MSLLEDLFLEDEAGEAQELERVLEGGGDDEYGERSVSPNSDANEERDDEAEEDKRRVDPTKGKEKRIIRNPRFVLNPARLTGPRGIQVIPDHYKDFKFKGKGNEKEDLDMVLKKLEHWAYRLYPKFGFQDCLKKIEMLGKKKVVMVHLTKIRSDQYTSEEIVVQKDSSDDEAGGPPEEDEFDKLLQQQIELARSTPAPDSVQKAVFSTPVVDRSHIMPKATSSPSISDEQRERMLRNRQFAEQRRLAKLRNDNSVDLTHISEKTVEGAVDLTSLQEKTNLRKHNRTNVFDSSDEEEANGPNMINLDTIKKQQHTENEATVDLTNFAEQTANMIVRKHNRSNVIDSDEAEYTTVNKDTVHLINAPVHTLNKDANNHTESNVLNSSDSEDTAAKESITINVDIHKKDVNIVDLTNISKQTIIPMNKKHSKSNIIQSPDEDTAANKLLTLDDHMKEKYTANNATVDLTNIPVTSLFARKHNNSNDMENADEEDASVVNDSMTVNVDVHINVESNSNNKVKEVDVPRDKGVDTNVNYNPDNSNKISNDNIQRKKAVFDNIETDSTEDIVMENTNKNPTNSVVDQNVISNESFKNIQLRTNNDKESNDNDMEKNAINDITKDNSTSFVNNKGNGNVNFEEDIMDVDFDDDF